MKKSQRLRFLALSAQTVRTAAEQAEFDTLATLAAKHTDASQDIDDTRPAAAKTVTISDFMAKFTALTSAKETLVRDNASLTQANKDLAAGNVGTVTLVAVLAALGLKAEDFAGKDAAAIATAIKAPAATDATAKDGQITTLTAERDTARAGYAAFGAALGMKEGTLIASAENIAAAGIAADDAEFAKLTTAQKTTRIVQGLVNAQVSARTLAQVRELGFNAEQLPAQQQAEVKNAKEMTYADFSKLSPGEKMTFSANGGKLTEVPTNWRN
jgi:hypothetical protein